MRKEAGHVVETAVEARAAYRDWPVAKVLMISTALVVVLFGIAYLMA